VRHVCKPFETEVDETKRYRPDEDTKDDANDNCYYKTFDIAQHTSSLRTNSYTNISKYAVTVSARKLNLNVVLSLPADGNLTSHRPSARNQSKSIT